MRRAEVGATVIRVVKVPGLAGNDEASDEHAAHLLSKLAIRPARTPAQSSIDNRLPSRSFLLMPRTQSANRRRKPVTAPIVVQPEKS